MNQLNESTGATLLP